MANAELQPSRFLTDSIERIIQERVRSEVNSSSRIHKQVLDCVRTLPSKSYGDTNLSDSSNAILGDVYQFYTSNNNGEQQHILQDLRKKVEELCQKQNDRDAKISQLHSLLRSSQATAPSGGRGEYEFQKEIRSLIARSGTECHPEDVLTARESIAIARRFLPETCIDTTSCFTELDTWLSTRGSTILLVTAEDLAEDAANDLAIRVTRHLRDTGHPVVWYFSDADVPEPLFQRNPVLRSLVLQMCVLTAVCGISENIDNDVDQVQGQSSDEDLVRLFRFVLAKVPACFVVVELPSLCELDNSGRRYAQELISIFSDAVHEASSQGQALKVLIVCCDLTVQPIRNSMQTTGMQECTIISTPMPLAKARHQAILMEEELAFVLGNAILVAE